MTQTLMVSVPAAKARMAIASDTLGIDPAVESAIKAAQLRVEAVLDSSLERREYTDVFHLDPEYFMDVTPGGLMRMQLSTGLLRSDVPIEVLTGRAWNTCTEPLDTALSSLDPVRGILSVDRQALQGMYCKVSYSAGYGAQDTLPEWLVEAISSYIPLVWNLGQPTNRSAEAEAQARLSAEHAEAILSRYHRNIGFTFRPVF